MSDRLLKLVLASVKPLLRDFTFKIDRANQIVTVTHNTVVVTLRFDQVIDYIEGLFNEPVKQ